jgi:hypothetical protein
MNDMQEVVDELCMELRSAVRAVDLKEQERIINQLKGLIPEQSTQTIVEMALKVAANHMSRG